jgi:hypothetical protein
LLLLFDLLREALPRVTPYPSSPFLICHFSCHGAGSDSVIPSHSFEKSRTQLRPYIQAHGIVKLDLFYSYQDVVD